MSLFMPQRQDILTFSGPSTNTDARRFLAIFLFLFAYGSLCTGAIWDAPDVIGNDRNRFDIIFLFCRSFQALVLTVLATRFLRKTSQGWDIFPWAAIAILTDLIPGISLFFASYLSVNNFNTNLFGYLVRVDDHPVLGRIICILADTDWPPIFIVACALFCSYSSRGFLWTRVAAFWCAGVLTSSFFDLDLFTMPQAGLWKWFAGAKMISALLLAACLATNRNLIKWAVVIGAMTSTAVSGWRIVNDWIFPDQAYTNQMQWACNTLFLSLIQVGPWLLM